MITGAMYSSKDHGDFKIITFNSSREVLVEFLSTGFRKWTRKDTILRGSIKDPYCPKVQGVGFIGEGNYLCTENNKSTTCYKSWSRMLERCYSYTSLKRHPTYKGCAVANEWHNFQNFAKWFHEASNYRSGWQLDKDMLEYNNKVYSPNTCVFLPPSINAFLTGGTSEYTFFEGVTYRKDQNTYRSKISTGGRQKSLGTFTTELEAFLVYKKAKIEILTSSLNEYLDKGLTKEVINRILVSTEKKLVSMLRTRAALRIGADAVVGMAASELIEVLLEE